MKQCMFVFLLWKSFIRGQHAESCAVLFTLSPELEVTGKTYKLSFLHHLLLVLFHQMVVSGSQNISIFDQSNSLIALITKVPDKSVALYLPVRWDFFQAFCSSSQRSAVLVGQCSQILLSHFSHSSLMWFRSSEDWAGQVIVKSIPVVTVFSGHFFHNCEACLWSLSSF